MLDFVVVIGSEAFPYLGLVALGAQTLDFVVVIDS